MEVFQPLLPSPVQEIRLPVFRKKEVRLFIKREDLIHPQLSGNKWRKLKYNLIEMKSKDCPHAFTFGGTFSNHLYAFASACDLMGIGGTAFIRGDGFDPGNPTLQHIDKCGIQIIFLDRASYKLKLQAKEVFQFTRKEKYSYYIPEGGSNASGLRGVLEMMEEIQNSDISFDRIAIAAGTGCTAAGISMKNKSITEVYPALKGTFMFDLIKQFNKNVSTTTIVIADYHFGGYGKFNKELIGFIEEFKSETGIPLDPVYTGKMMYGLVQRIKNNVYPSNTTILAIHTGGLQGIAGFRYKYGLL
ncbi:MAG TPA: pyridoxal-phosphate dependent enzyme [Saprospiraceae bacterium]|nr:pyridoxal-phosphate dependent enzyme [Saprospiraceae bacterium]